ncbi:flagellar biosynthetic protein FliO, partial [Bradyrhizobium sp. P5_C11_2]
MQGSPITFIVAFIVVLALIGVAAWLVRRFATSRLGANTQRGRMPRLAVIDAAAVDGRRRLVLVRRDNVEHLLMIGGPTDIVVEPNIVRAAPGRDQLPQRSNAAEPPRLAPMPDTGGWADEAPRPELLDHPEPQMPEPPPRPARPSFADEVRRPAPALAERRSDPLPGFTPEPIAPPRPEREPRPEPMPPRVARGEPPLMPRPPRQSEPVKVPPVRAERAVAPPPPPPVPQAPPVPVAPPV